MVGNFWWKDGRRVGVVWLRREKDVGSIGWEVVYMFFWVYLREIEFGLRGFLGCDDFDFDFCVGVFWFGNLVLGIVWII